MTFNKPPEWGRRFRFPENLKTNFDDLRMTEKIYVQMADNYETAVAEEIAAAARSAGVTDCAVLNKKAVLDALKKQIPTKPHNTATRWPLCPSCNRFIDRHEHKHGNIDIPYCKWCGQAIDWGSRR